MTKRTLTLKRDRLTELTGAEMSRIAGGPTGTGALCLCWVTNDMTLCDWSTCK